MCTNYLWWKISAQKPVFTIIHKNETKNSFTANSFQIHLQHFSQLAQSASKRNCVISNAMVSCQNLFAHTQNHAYLIPTDLRGKWKIKKQSFIQCIWCQMSKKQNVCLLEVSEKERGSTLDNGKVLIGCYFRCIYETYLSPEVFFKQRKEVFCILL